MIYKITEVIAKLYEKNRFLLEGGILSDNEKKYYNNIVPGMNAGAAAGAISTMADFMRRYYGGKKVIIL